MGDLRFERLNTGSDALGESPVWNALSQSLWWIDGVAGKVRELRADGTVQTLQVTGHVGAIALVEGNGIVATIDQRVFWLDPETKAERLLVEITDAPETMRLNDGKLDRQGRFVCIGMGRGGELVGDIHGFGKGRHRVLAETGVMIGNGICFSPDGGTLYFTDTRARTSFAADYDTETGDVGAIRPHIDCTALGSGIDGATVDADGNMWAVLIHTGEIGCFAPDGRVLHRTKAPVDYPSSLAFGGAGMDVLYMTSIRDSGTGRVVSKSPDGGGLFSIRDHGARGIEEACFQGMMD
ncbi:sugar lactone lactonase YvrE [Sagittula marina]|uniref:Sugar lactone lactonase YvrE n=1 Tax=Sagittula marina TaxID=943940 RepID=A0A7W6DLE4_9RHOB|nr:SMP-30/gluconolactonase/LRE family protein [Sagittula marina]MBB3985360.1 sugar lactone lactonase YvrE [Sagittula marina]